MYQNNQLDLLINAYEGSIPPNVAQVIATIQAIYKAYNDDTVDILKTIFL